MFRKLEDLPEISSIYEPYKGITEFELERVMARVPEPSDEAVFVGRFGEQVVVCVGKVLEYEEVPPDFARLKIQGTCAIQQ